MELRNLIDFCDMSENDWESLCGLAAQIKAHPRRYESACAGRVMATLFYEPSTRTQLSFQAAMLRLGGACIGFADPNSSSVSKGETLRDTIKIVSNYSDLAVMRNPIEGAAYAASLYSRVPVINAGDGGHLHPTQTMADLFTIRSEKGRYEDLSIGLCGDLRNGRTVHSLLKAFTRWRGNRFYLISTDELRLPDYVYDQLSATDNQVVRCRSLDECISELDILYMTRIQKERFASDADYQSQKGVYVLTADKMARARKDLTVLHPLPKVDEIAPEVDDDPRCRFFEQAENGMYIRMALILSLTESWPDRLAKYPAYPLPTRRFCDNPMCVSNHERYLPELSKDEGGRRVCRYCEHELIPERASEPAVPAESGGRE